MKTSPSWTPTYKNPRFVSCIRLLDPAADDVVVTHAPHLAIMPAATAAHKSLQLPSHTGTPRSTKVERDTASPFVWVTCAHLLP